MSKVSYKRTVIDSLGVRRALMSHVYQNTGKITIRLRVSMIHRSGSSIVTVLTLLLGHKSRNVVRTREKHVFFFFFFTHLTLLYV